MSLIFDFIEEVAYGFKDMCDGIRDDARQLGDELTHLNDPCYVSPVQKKHDAAEKINKADNKLFRKQEQYEKCYNRVNEKLHSNMELKMSLLERIEHKDSCCEKVYLSRIDMEGGTFRQVDEYKFGEFLGVFGHGIRDEAANKYLEDAKDYAMEVNCLCAKIDDKKARLMKIEEKIEIEEQLLSVLMTNIKEKELQNNKKMVTSIKKLLNMSICDDSGNIKNQYVEELEKLKDLV